MLGCLKHQKQSVFNFLNNSSQSQSALIIYNSASMRHLPISLETHSSELSTFPTFSTFPTSPTFSTFPTFPKHASIVAFIQVAINNEFRVSL